ncbi:MAG: amidohydrolase family protein, partial [Candidatus Oleimicrobiaceae bacterium]
MKGVGKYYSRREFLRTAAQSAVAAGVVATGASLVPGCERTEFDLLIRGGMLYDGRGGPPVRADVGIRGERIVAVGHLASSSARTLVDVDNLAVAPGFIDVHSHTDIGLLVNPKAESKIRQGVTTEISGNCGASPFPIAGPTASLVRAEIGQEYELTPDWHDAEGFL